MGPLVLAGRSSKCSKVQLLVGGCAQYGMADTEEMTVGQARGIIGNGWNDTRPQCVAGLF